MHIREEWTNKGLFEFLDGFSPLLHKRILMTIPDHSVTVWIKESGNELNLHMRLVEAAGKNPYESTELEDMRDFHWGFNSESRALEFADSLLEFAKLDDVVKLVVSSKDGARKLYKDFVPSR